MAASSSSSSASMVKGLSPRVYLNFHGVDLRNNFISHLGKALREEGIEYFIYNHLVTRVVYLDNLWKEIDDSKIALTIFSERYSQSNWCLNELVKIMKNKKDKKLIVIPIFYKVDVLDVKYSMGEFGDNLNRGGDRDISNMRKWENALTSVTDRNGFTSADFRTDGDLIFNIVMAIKKLIAKISPISEAGKGTDMFSTNVQTVSSSSNILSGTIASMVKPLSPRVYINFQGVDVRNNFISHLEKALRESSIECFIDHDLVSGCPPEILFNKIDDSDIALAIFSERYSLSKWCLNELVKIMENVEDNKLVVIPIFFKVKVKDVKYMTGEFGMNFYKGSRCGYKYSPNMQKWEKALESVANIKGFSSSDYRTDGELIVNIVLEIKNILAQISPLREVEDGNNMLYANIQTASSSSNILSGTIDQPRMDLPLKQLEEKLFDFKWAEVPTVDSNISTSHPHQVFINFRGELRYNFISHLVDALRRKSINVFIDTQENRGEDISHLLKRIEDSRIAIVVFSSKYTESKWCLREAERIMERATQGKLKVLPIFYKVNPTNVKQLKGEFGDNFRDREWEYRNDESLIKKWKEALAYIAGKIGFALNDQSDENDSIASIVNEVLRMLTSIPLDTQTGESWVNQLYASGVLSPDEPPDEVMRMLTSIPLDTQTGESCINQLYASGVLSPDEPPDEVMRMLTSIPLDTQTGESCVNQLYASGVLSPDEPPDEVMRMLTSIPLDTQTGESWVSQLYASCGLSPDEPPTH